MKKMGINGNIPVATGKGSNGMNLRGLRDEAVAYIMSVVG